MALIALTAQPKSADPPLASPVDPSLPGDSPSRSGSRPGGPPSRPGGPRASRTELRALSVCALLAALAIAHLAQPVSIGLLLGTLTAFTLHPLYKVLCRRLQRPALAALLCTLGFGLAAVGALTGLGALLIQRGILLSASLLAALQPGGALRLLAERGSRRLLALHLLPGQLADTSQGVGAPVIERLRGLATELASRLAGLATTIAGVTASGILGFLFLLLTTWYVLQSWGALTRRMEVLLPLNPRHTRALLEEFRRVGRQVLLGTVGTGAAQGALAGLGYLVTQVPEPAFFGALTAVASLLPAVGTLLVWVPAGIYLLLTDHVALGVVQLIYGAVVVVGVSDYVVRPALIGGHGEVPTLLTLVALFGGVEAFGLIGLILGPVIVALALALLRIYGQEVEYARRAAGHAPSNAMTNAMTND